MITDTDRAALRVMLERDEGKRAYPYDDATGRGIVAQGKVTIGIGRNLTDVGLHDDEIELLISNDIAAAVRDLEHAIPWALELPALERRVMINLAFNLGIAGLLKFRTFLGAMQRRDAAAAVAALKDSKWHNQVGARAVRLESMITFGSDRATPPGELKA